MDGLINFLNDMVRQSANSYSANGPKAANNRWKYCVALAERGWKAHDYEYVPTDTNDDVIIKWRKEGEVEVKVRLSFTEQCLWIKYLEQKEQRDEQEEQE